MATRVTDAQLYKMVEEINESTDNLYDFSLDFAYGGVRLVRDGGSREVSGRMSRPELWNWFMAFNSGMTFAMKVGYYGEQALKRQYEASRH